MIIRDAAESDLRAILEIYNHAVVHTTAIWNEAQVDLDNRAAWLADRGQAGLPVLVAVGEAGAVLGYASFGPWRAWDGYRQTVEHSIYVQADARGGGVGRALMEALIERARAAGKHVMIAGIEGANIASIRLHEGLGFEHAGRCREVGAKFGRWLDLVFMELRLDARGAPD
jgi:L-amino acid N-acyltransferase YncA